MSEARGALEPPAGLAGEALVRWRAVVGPLEQRGPIDVDLLTTYCQVWARWRQAEAALAKTGQLVRNKSGQPVASPLISVSSQAGAQVRALEKQLGLEQSKRDAAAADEAAGARRRRGGKKGEAPHLTRRELAERLEVHMQTVTKWERDGMPIAVRGAKGRASYYDEAEVRAWRQLRDESARGAGGATDLQADRARKERAQAALAEQAYQIRMRDLLPREEVEQAWAAEVAAVRARLLALPTTLADRVHRAATTEGVSGVEQVLADAVRDALRELAGEAGPVAPA